MPDTAEEPGMVRRFKVEAEVGGRALPELVRNEDGRRDAKVGETKEDRESRRFSEP